MMYKQTTTFVFSLLFFMLSASLFAQEDMQVLQQKIQSQVDRYIADQGFSGTILVADQGQVIYHQAYGLSDRKAKRPMTAGARFAIASITKMMTSIRILQLVEQGKIELDESFNTYLPTWEKQISKKITLHHLLLHTSGLPHEEDRIYWQPLTAEEIVTKSLARKSKGRIGKFNYNNVDYLLLGLLIEKITGNSWETEMREQILTPCGMTSTGFLAYDSYPPQFAKTYTFSEDGEPVADPNYYIENFHAAGNMYATATDLLKLDQALYRSGFLSESSKQLLAISNPDLGYVGYGVWNYRYPFIEAKPLVMERRGGVLGAHVVLIRLTEVNKTIIILSNDDRFNPDSFGDENNLREMLIRALF